MTSESSILASFGNTSQSRLGKDAIFEGPYWPEPISVVADSVSPHGFVTVEAVGLDTRKHYTTTLPLSLWETLRAERAGYTFNAPAQPFRLALEAERLRLAYAADPLLAANNARVHLLPHQIEAVYGYMLPQPRIRHLMAHDAGAGKTIMGGLLYKELASREPELRTLIVAPAALTVQWQREMREKFLVEFEIVDREQLRENGQIWSESPRLITSLPFARQADVIATLANVQWDLVIVDEAHHMAGYEKRETQAYRLGCVLSQNTKHLVLATATPHKGDAANFLKLLQLLDGGIHNPGIVSHQLPGQRGTPLMLRRLKEEMVDFDGNDLFKPRQVETRWHAIGDNPPEMTLYTALTDYVSRTYRAAERIGGQIKVNTEFAMVILQRRMASSFAALQESLHRRREGLLLAIESLEPGVDWGELEEQPEGERWTRERQAELATPAKSAQEREKEIVQIDELLDMLEAVRQSGIETKVEALQRILDETGVSPGNGEKLLVFTEFKDTLDFLRRLFEGWGYSVTQIDGSMDHDLRRQAEADFQDTCQVMVATEAAGEGINLQFCATMVNYDLPWVPTRLEQRMGRIHRYGQKRVARIYNLVAADTREGQVLAGLLERLEEMRTHLGDQVFDVVSVLVSDVQVEKLMAQAATAPTTEASQDRALQTLIQAIEAGEARYKQWQEHPFAISTGQFRQMQQASRQSRLTPEYAQHFFVDVLAELHETPVALEDVDQPAGDAAVFSVALRRNNIAQTLGLPVRKRQLFSFREEPAEQEKDAQFLALGTDLFDRTLQLVHERWGDTLQRGAKFIDVDLPPGASYLLWFLATEARDGLGQRVAGRLFAVKQTTEGLASAAASSLIDLIPAPGTFLVPETLQNLARSREPVIEWSIREQQLPFLQEVQQQREYITDLRRKPLLADAQAAVQEANRTYNELVFASFNADPQALHQVEARREEAQARIVALKRRFEHEGACSLGPTRVVGVAAVFSLAEPPEQDLSDERPDVAAAAEELVRQYEERQGRGVRDVSGEHDKYPYDIHSTGPGGVRCIEVKGTTTGRIMLRENQRRAARRLGKSYYLYVVRDPLDEHPRLTIIRDPLSRLDHDEVLYSGARYVYHATTWRAAADEEISL
jgi:superfamily II DNA or RNA helicase